MKKGILVLMCLLVTIIFNSPIRATESSNSNSIEVEFCENEKDSITVRYTNINAYNNSFNISSKGLATGSVDLRTNSTDKVKVSCYLQQFKNGNWLTIDSKIATDYDGEIFTSIEKYVVKGYSYRFKTYAYCYSNGTLIENDYWNSRTIVY